MSRIRLAFVLASSAFVVASTAPGPVLGKSKVPPPEVALRDGLTLEVAFPEIDLWIAPVVGDVQGPAKARARARLFAALEALPQVRVFDLEAFARLAGPEAQAALAGCSEDACLRAAARAVRSDALVASVLERAERGAMVLHLRLIETSTRVVAARVTREVPDLEHLPNAVNAAVADLLPERSKTVLGRLVLVGELPPNATLELDGLPHGPLAEDPEARPALRLPKGEHTLRIDAPGHRPFATTVVLRGAQTEVAPELIKNRSSTPWVLGAIGGATAGLGAVLGLAARNTAEDWREACGGGRCQEGFTRFRYEEDRANVDRQRISANALYIMSAVAVVAGALWFILDPGVDEVSE